MSREDPTLGAAVDALAAGLAEHHDFGGFLSQVLAQLAAETEGGTEGLTAGRPGSWEAQHVQALVCGVTGYAEGGYEQHLPAARPGKAVVTPAPRPW